MSSNAASRMTTGKPKLRVGLLLGSTSVPAWVRVMIARIASSDYAQIVLVVIDGSPKREEPTLLRRLAHGPKSLAQRALHHGLSALIWGRVDKHRPAIDAFAITDISDLTANIPPVAARPVLTLWSDKFTDEDLANIRAHAPDVLIRIGFRILRGGILTVAPYGVWSYHHGDNQINRGGPPGFWEAMEFWPVTGCTLQQLSEDLDNGLVLARTWSTTVSGSASANNQATYWKSLSLVPRELRRLHQKGAAQYFADVRAAEPHPHLYSRRLFRPASNMELLHLLSRKIYHYARGAITRHFHYDQWSLMFHLSDSFASSLWRYTRVNPPPGSIWADPFVLQRDDGYYIFFEDLDRSRGKGRISVMRVDANGKLAAPQPALETDHHLSYPFVFEADGQVYMIPESRAAHCIALYRCLEFPGRWEKVMNLMENVEAVDATLHFHEGRWWLFVNIMENAGASTWDELFAFHADHFATQAWTPHALNPIVSDVRTSRPAGRLILRDGKLYRPSQDSSYRYGWALNLNLVEQLDPDHYRESLVTKATPGWARDVVGIHTYNSAGRMHVADVELRRRRWPLIGPN